MLDQLEPREHVARVPHQSLEQRELLRGQLDLHAAASDLAAGRVEAQVPDLEHRGPFRPAAPGERAKPGVQLGERERLHEVVVGAAVEPSHAILDRVAGREDQHRRPHPALAQGPANLEARHVGQHQIEHDRVVVDPGRHDQALLAVGRDVGGPPLLPQGAADDARHPDLVLHYQHAHGTHIVPRLR